MKRIHLLLLLLISSVISFAQDFSNKGKDFWVGYGNHVRMFNGGGREKMQIYITSDVNTTGNVSINSLGFNQNYAVTANQITVIDIPNSAALMDDGLYDHGIHITAVKPVVAYGFIYVSNISGATLFLPTNTLGKNYYSLNYTQLSNEANSYSYFFVCATDTGTTTIEITPSQNTKGGFPAGVTQTITLSQGQIYQVLADVDLTGSTIKSVAGANGVTCKKIAVFCGSGKVTLGCPGGTPASSDNLYQQMYPASSWGKKYILVPSVNNPFGNPVVNTNFFRIFRPDPSSIVQLNGSIIPSTDFVNNYYEFSANTAGLVESNQPVLVAQYFTSQNDNCGSGNNEPHDPDMIYLNPVEQTLSNVTLNSMQPNSGTNISQHFINVVLRNSGTGVSSFLVDGLPPSDLPTILPWDNGYAYLQIQVSRGPHNLSCDSGFNAIVYGFGNHESYGYSAGANLKDLYNFIQPLNPLNISGTNSACACTPFYYTITYPFQPLSLHWDFKGFQPDETVSNPVADSTYFINGKQVWRYKLPTPYTYCPAGNYPLSITAGTAGTDGCGNTQVKDDTIFVRNTPTPDFSWVHSGCISDSVKFSDISIYDDGVNSYRWTWDFGDGTTSTEHNPVHKYSSSGNFTVSFSLITNIGCISTIRTKQIVVTEAPVAKFGVSAPTCLNKDIIFSDSSTVTAPGTIGIWHWNFGDGTTLDATNNANIIHQYTTAGQKTITLEIETASGCRSFPFEKDITVHPNPVADFSMPAKVCLPYDVANFTDASTIADGTEDSFSRKWKFGEPSSGINDSAVVQNPSHLYSTGGPFSVQLAVTSGAGCVKDTTKIFNNVFAKASGGFTANAENCLNTVTNLTSTSNGQGNTITSWHWDFGDEGITGTGQNTTHTYATADTFTISHWITTDKGCNSDTATQAVIVNPLPAADFNFSASTCEKSNITITDASVPGAGVITSWTWNFGMGRPDSVLTNGLPVVYRYDTTGSYTVSLSVVTDKGCATATPFSKTIVISPLPKPGFISPEVCLTDASAIFVDSSSVAVPGTITNWQWNFGDPASGVNNTFNGLNATHRYNAIGLYTATLTVTSNSGCTAAINQSFTVNGDVPRADFVTLSTGNLCANDSVSIQDNSTVNFGNVTKVEIYWDNAGAPAVKETDDLPTAGKVYTHLYPDFQNPLTKDFTVRYLAYSGTSCVDDEIKTVRVNASPKVQFNTVAPVCLDAVSYQLTEAIETGGVPGTGLFSGAGISSTGLFDPSVTGVGTFNILYTYTSNFGCVDTMSNTVTVLSPATANFGFSTPGCEKNSITFTDSSSIPTASGNIANWSWNFGDGSAVINNNTATSVTHIYANAGSYTATLTITTNNGCIVSRQKSITVNPLPLPNFTFPASACLPDASVTFTDASTIADGTENAFTYQWRFDDIASGTNTSVSKNPTHIYTTDGIYRVTLICTSGAGCKDSITIPVDIIHPQPTAAFTSDSVSICENQSVRFRDNSTGADGTVNKWNWDFDNGSSSDLQFPTSQTYNIAKVYTVELQVENTFGCKDTATIPFTVYANPVMSAGRDTVLLEGGEITLNATASGNGLQFLWTPATYLSNNRILRPVLKGIPDDMIYTLQVVAQGGCWKTDDVLVKLLKAPVIPNTFTPNGDGINDTWVIMYLESYPECRLRVFNRDGQAVYESLGYQVPGWDGKYKGKKLPFGTYYYVIEPGSGRKPITGYVTLIY